MPGGGGDPLPCKETSNSTPHFAQKLGANPSSSLPDPRKGPYFTHPSAQLVRCSHPDHLHPPAGSPPAPLEGAGRGGSITGFFYRANFLVTFILSVALWRLARKSGSEGFRNGENPKPEGGGCPERGGGRDVRELGSGSALPSSLCHQGGLEKGKPKGGVCGLSSRGGAMAGEEDEAPEPHRGPAAARSCNPTLNGHFKLRASPHCVFTCFNCSFMMPGLGKSTWEIWGWLRRGKEPPNGTRASPSRAGCPWVFFSPPANRKGSGVKGVRRRGMDGERPAGEGDNSGGAWGVPARGSLLPAGGRQEGSGGATVPRGRGVRCEPLAGAAGGRVCPPRFSMELTPTPPARRLQPGPARRPPRAGVTASGVTASGAGPQGATATRLRPAKHQRLKAMATSGHLPRRDDKQTIHSSTHPSIHPSRPGQRLSLPGAAPPPAVTGPSETASRHQE
ncbi:uncharacterized protein LOC128853922 [Cuculus canorus]|uniref:uncharacterized protein LOC128853922 n=1 Tax=Cuculus canorus TaxID=55661 RepID=UPI0023AA85E8|nr:uncharacterized protein LOC128853922 [Cuculus canorus]